MAQPPTLRSWLRRPPQPSSLRFRNENDDERTIKLGANVRNKWKDAEEALLAGHACAVDALDEKGEIIRSMVMPPIGDDGAPLDAEEVAERKEAKEVGRHHRELANVLDAQGKRHNEAFQLGVQAASVAQDGLLGVIDILSSQWASAMTQLHSVSLRYGRALQAQEDGEEAGGGNPAIEMMLAGAIRKAFGMGMEATPAAASTNGAGATNGTSPPKPKKG
jgi:hypothetical protein